MAWQDRPYNQYDYQPTRSMGGGFSSKSAVFWLICINAVVFLLDMILRDSGRWPGISAVAPREWGDFSVGKAVYGFQIWRWVTYQFLHHDLMHLFFNMLGLYFFGPLIERWWGTRRFLGFYLLCGVGGAMLYMLLSFVPGLLGVTSRSGLIGASGCIFGVLVACAVLYPKQQVMLMFPPIPMTMRTMALVFLGIGVVSVILQSSNAGGEAAHLGGAGVGWLLIKNPKWLSFADRNWGDDLRRHRSNRQKEMTAKEQVEVDRILDKVREKGLSSLTGREKKALQRATDRQRRTG